MLRVRLRSGAPSFAPALPVAPASFTPTMMLAEGPAEVALGEELMYAAEEVAKEVAKAVGFLCYATHFCVGHKTR